jgi:hypothetical protein
VLTQQVVEEVLVVGVIPAAHSPPTDPADAMPMPPISNAIPASTMIRFGSSFRN